MVLQVDANILSGKGGDALLRIGESRGEGIGPGTALRRREGNWSGSPSEMKFDTKVPEPKSVAAALRPLLAALKMAAPCG